MEAKYTSERLPKANWAVKNTEKTLQIYNEIFDTNYRGTSDYYGRNINGVVVSWNKDKNSIPDTIYTEEQFIELTKVEDKQVESKQNSQIVGSKFTKEYAEKLANERLVNGTFTDFKSAIVYGYMKAIEETAAPDLLEALIWAKEQFKILQDKGLYPEHFLQQNGGNGIMPIVNAINKATK